jgi:glycolate oxidase iron-sulfur subunit
MTTCPSGVHYMHLVDQARDRIEATYRRPLAERGLRWFLATVLPRPALFRLALIGGVIARPLLRRLSGRLGALAALIPARLPPRSPVDRPQVFPATAKRRRRVALLAGCAQQVVAPGINEATVRLLTRLGCEVVVAPGAGCCGGLTHHLGRPALDFARANIDAWTREIERGGLDAVVINTSGCGVTVRDYGYMLRGDDAYAAKAARISALTRDLCELVAEIGLGPATVATGQRVAYHAACSLQHGQRIREPPKALLGQAGFTVLDVPEGHLCCGSAGTYNMLQPEIAAQLGARKVANIESTAPEIIAAGNVGCITQIGQGTKVPVVHTVELLDWATGGPKPAAIAGG